MSTKIEIGKLVIDDLVLKERINVYEETRERITKFKNKNMSDKEIIEALVEEIEQYRNRIKNQNEIIEDLKQKTIQSEEVILSTVNDEEIDTDITEIITTIKYADGKPVILRTEYKYKENKENEENNEKRRPPSKSRTKMCLRRAGVWS